MTQRDHAAGAAERGRERRLGAACANQVTSAHIDEILGTSALRRGRRRRTLIWGGCYCRAWLGTAGRSATGGVAGDVR